MYQFDNLVTFRQYPFGVFCNSLVLAVIGIMIPTPKEEKNKKKKKKEKGKDQQIENPTNM